MRVADRCVRKLLLHRKHAGRYHQRDRCAVQPGARDGPHYEL